jgi:hypothetical protein
MNLNKFGLYLPFPKGMSFGGGGDGSGGTAVRYFFRYANSGTGDIGNISNWSVPRGRGAIMAATRLPGSSDDVILYGEVTSDSSGGHFTAKGSVKSVTIYTNGNPFPDYYTFNGVMYVNGNPFSGVYNGTHYVNGLKAIFHFNDTASGASANNDLSDPLNYWFDAAWTIPAGTVPSLNDDVVIDSIVYNDSTGIGVVGFNSVTVSSTGLVTTNIHITTASFTNNSQFTGGFSKHYYTNGVFDTSINGLYFDSYPPTGYALFVNGVSNSFFTGGYNGTHYTNGVADTFTGVDTDYYYYDPTGTTYYFFYNGYWLTGGYNGTHYTNGVADTFTGVDTDYYTSSPACYLNGGTGSWDALGYCCGDATRDCAGNYYSPSNEDANGDAWTDPNGTKCSSFSTDALGYCCGDAIQVFNGSWCSPSGEAYGGGATCLTDPNGNVCQSNSLDGLSYCYGDSILDCAENLYSPSNEDGNTHTDPNGSKCNPNSVDALGYCCGTCNDSSACGEDGSGCLYDYGCGCGNPAPDCNGVCGGCCADNCGNCGNSHGGCTDGNACNYDSCANYNDGSCQYDYGCGCGNPAPDCNGDCGGTRVTDACGNCVSNAAQLPTIGQVLAGVQFGCGRSLTGTFNAASVPDWDNYANYSQGDVVLAGGSLWYLSSTGGWTVGGAPSAGYGWQRLSTETQSSENNTGIDFARLIGLPPFINL